MEEEEGKRKDHLYFFFVSSDNKVITTEGREKKGKREWVKLVTKEKKKGVWFLYTIPKEFHFFLHSFGDYLSISYLRYNVCVLCGVCLCGTSFSLDFNIPFLLFITWKKEKKKYAVNI